MIRRIILSLVLLSPWASNVSADIAPPPHLKRVDPRVRFHGIEDYPDHVFFLRFYNVNGNPRANDGTRPSLVELKSSDEFDLKGRGFTQFVLIALPRKDFEKRKAEDPTLSWLEGEPYGRQGTDLSWLNKIPEVQYATVKSPPTVASAYASEAPLTEYRVTFNVGRLVVDVVAMTEPNYTPPLERWPVLVGVIFVVAALAGAGVWFFRRRRAPPI